MRASDRSQSYGDKEIHPESRILWRNATEPRRAEGLAPKLVSGFSRMRLLRILPGGLRVLNLIARNYSSLLCYLRVEFELD